MRAATVARLEARRAWAQTHGMKASASLRTEVLAAVRSFWSAYAKRKTADVLQACIPEDDLCIMGSGADEIYLGRRGAIMGMARDWAQSESMRVVVTRARVSGAGKVAWLHGDCAFHGVIGGQPFVMRGRISLVLEKRRGRWLLALSHFSSPNAAQATGQSFA